MDVWDYWFFGCFMALCAVGCATWAISGDHERRAREDADGRQLARERQAPDWAELLTCDLLCSNCRRLRPLAMRTRELRDADP